MWSDWVDIFFGPTGNLGGAGDYFRGELWIWVAQYLYAGLLLGLLSFLSIRLVSVAIDGFEATSGGRAPR